MLEPNFNSMKQSPNSCKNVGNTLQTQITTKLMKFNKIIPKLKSNSKIVFQFIELNFNQWT
jgi:hypothetical protein